MKRIISLLLCVTMLLSSTNRVFADEVQKDIYSTVSVEFSDNTGNLEKLQVMVKNDNVYANAEELATRLGYDVGVLEDHVTIYNKETDDNVPYGLTVFYYDSTKVKHMLFSQKVDIYEAPFQTIKNENGVWIPLEYALLLLNSSMLVVDNTILIDMPSKNIIDIYLDVANNSNIYSFDWNKDFGYSEIDWKITGSASHVVNMFNGLLDMDGASWVQFVQMFAMDSSAYDSKYGESIAELFCTYSDKELEQEVKHVKKIMGYFNGSGTLGKALSTLEDSMPTDDDIGKLQEICQDLKDKIDGSNESVTAYNRAYQTLENATDKAILFDNTVGVITGVQKQVKEVTGITEKMFTIAEVVGYAKEFQNQDKFAVESLMSFIQNKDSQDTMSNAMKSGIEVYTYMLQQDILTYSALQYLMKNYDSLLADAFELSSSLGTQANLILIGWNFVKSVDRFKIGDKIDAADQFELATYGTIFQSDAFIDYLNIRNNTFNNVQNITPENLYEVTQSCYAYLKFCYITREAAIASLKAKTENTQEKIQPLVDYQNSINEEIAGYLVQLKNADKTNKNGCYGFLLGDNEEYLKEYNDEALISIIGSAKVVTFEMLYESGLESAIIKGLDNNGNVVWEYRTDTYELCMLDSITEIGVYGDRYYFVENGTVVSMKIADGTIMWENSNFDGAGTDFEFGDDGTLYMCGFDAPDFFAVDKNGKTLARISSFSRDYGGAYKIEYLGDKVLVTLEIGYDDGRPVTFCVNLEDFSFAIEDVELKLSDEQLKEICLALGVPKGLDVQIMQGEPTYWDAGGTYYTSVSIYYNGEFIAGASVDSLTGELIKNIYMYSGNS